MDLKLRSLEMKNMSLRNFLKLFPSKTFKFCCSDSRRRWKKTTKKKMPSLSQLLPTTDSLKEECNLETSALLEPTKGLLQLLRVLPSKTRGRKLPQLRAPGKVSARTPLVRILALKKTKSMK
jgi:hypothetical protein